MFLYVLVRESLFSSFQKIVSFRKSYLLENNDLSQEQVNSVNSTGFDFSISSYKASRVLIKSVDRPNLYRYLDKLKQGQDINSVFAMYH